MIYNFKNIQISNFTDWEEIVFKHTKKQKHWKEGRSAYCIADFMMNKNGQDILTDLVSQLLSEKIEFQKGIPEFETRFDKYGHGREHDLGIFAKTSSGKSVFIGVESKVDEPFGENVSEVYLKAKAEEINGKSTQLPQRIEDLIKSNFPKATLDAFNHRYQLLYSTMGTISVGTDISILLIIVFKTDGRYDSIKGVDNYKDYIRFIEATDSREIKFDNAMDVHEVKIANKKLISVYMSI